MKSPIGQRTLLSIAVAASLACISGGNALADGSISYSGGNESGVIEITGTYEDNLVLYDPDQESSLEQGETISSLLSTLPSSGEIVLSLDGVSDSDILDIKGSVYGIATAYDDEIVSKANLTINVTNAKIQGAWIDSNRAGTPDSILYGVYASGSSKVTLGDVTINIVNSILGDSKDGYEDVVIGARASDSASLTVGDVTVTVSDMTAGEEFAWITGVKHSSEGDITTGSIYVEIDGNEEGGRVTGYSQGTFEKIHPSGNAYVEDVTVIINGGVTDPVTGETIPSTFTGYAYGCNMTWMVPKVTIGDIVLELSNIATTETTETEFVGLRTRNVSGQIGESYIYETSVTANSVSVKAKNINNPSTGSFRAIEKFDAGTVTVTVAVSLAAERMSTASHSINAISQGGGTLNIGGLTSMYVKDVNSLNIYAFRAEFYSDTSPSETKINATMNGIDLVYISTDSKYQVTNNIYGAATETGGEGHIETIKTGDISVTIAGDAATMGFDNTVEDSGFNSIYGTVQGSGTIDHGTRTLIFGYVGPDIDSNESNVPFTSDGTNYSFNATFSNFDEVVVKNGSSLYITDSQKGFNFTDSCGSFFKSGDEASDGSLWSEYGILYLVAEDKDNGISESKLTIEERGTADILTLVNNGTIQLDGDLTTYTSSETIVFIDDSADGEDPEETTYTSGNAGTISGTGSLTIAKGTEDTYINTGTIDISKFTLGESVGLQVDKGSITVNESADLSGSGTSVSIAKDATGELNVSGEINAQISVLGKLALGEPDGFATATNAGVDSSANNVLVVSKAVTVGDGSISVGSEAADGLNFSGDSTLVVDASAVTVDGSDAAITGSGSATVAEGATVILYGDISLGRYNIISGYDTSGVEGWVKDDPEDTSSTQVQVVDSIGLTWKYYRDSDDNTVYIVTTEHEDILEVPGFEDVADPHIVDDALDHCSSDPGSSLLCGILRSDESTEDKVKDINSITDIAFAGGVMATSMTDTTAAIDSVHNHLTMDGDTFGKDGNLWPWDRSSNLWIDILGSWQHGKHLNATGISNYKYRTNTYGFILGYDYKLPDRPVVIGGAFSFSDGELKSKGGAVDKTKNEYQTYGVHLYGNYSPSPAFNLIGSLHWLHNSADIKQSTSAGVAKAKVQTNLVAVGLRGETTLKAGQVNIIPHVEGRYIYGKTGKFTTKLGGDNLWTTKADGTHTVQFPVGVAARTDIKTNSGWNIRPKADVSVIPQAGSTKQKTTIRAYDGVSDTMEGQFMGKFGASVKLGVQADKSNATVGLRYGFLGGTKGRADHSVMLQGRLRF